MFGNASGTQNLTAPYIGQTNTQVARYMHQVLRTLIQNAIGFRDFLNLDAIAQGQQAPLLEKHWHNLWHCAPTAAVDILKLLMDDDEDYGTLILAFFTHMLHGTKAMYTQGVPGAGKTKVLSIMAILIAAFTTETVIWSARDNAPLEAGALMLHELLRNAAPEFKTKFGRYPASKAPSVSCIDIAHADRRAIVDSTQVTLITGGAWAADYRRCYTGLPSVPMPTLLFF